MNSTNLKEPNPTLSPTTHATTPFALLFETPDSDLSSPFKGPLHYGAAPELTFRSFDNDNNVILDVDDDPLNCFSPSNVGNVGLDDIDDVFSIYFDVKKLEEKEGENVVSIQDDVLQKGGGFVVGNGGGVGGGRRKRKERGKNVIKTQPRKQRQRRLVNETSFVEPRKAMASEELAELWAIDPKRAKRIVANRHSAARSKERKAQYILNLEEKVKKLNWEVTSLTTRLTTNQMETTELAAEKSEIKSQLQQMECQAEQIDAQIEGLKLEIECLKTAIMEMEDSQMCESASLQFTPFSIHQKQLPLLHNSQPSMIPYLHVTSSQPLINTMAFNLARSAPLLC